MNFDYRGYKIVISDGYIFAFKDGEMVATADTVDSLIEILNDNDY